MAKLKRKKPPAIKVNTDKLIGHTRQVEYKPSRGDELIGYMAEGHSVTAAAAQMGVVSSTIYNWAREHSEFSDALKRGMAARVLYLETKLLCANDAASVAAAMFALKNACPEEWGEKHQVTTGVAEHGNASPE